MKFNLCQTVVFETCIIIPNVEVHFPSETEAKEMVLETLEDVAKIYKPTTSKAYRTALYFKELAGPYRLGSSGRVEFNYITNIDWTCIGSVAEARLISEVEVPLDLLMSQVRKRMKEYLKNSPRDYFNIIKILSNYAMYDALMKL